MLLMVRFIHTHLRHAARVTAAPSEFVLCSGVFECREREGK